MQDYLKQYHQIHKLHPHELNDNIAEYLMRGCGSGGHVDLFGFLIQTYPNISTRDCIYYGFKSAIYHQKNDFIISLCQQYPKTIEDAKNAMAAMGRPDIIEQLPPCPHEYSGIAIFSEYWFRDASSAKKYLSKFTQPENIDKLCTEIEKRPEIDKLVLKELPRIKEYALKIIDFKARYAVTTAQATLLCEHPDIFELILTSKYRGKEKELFALIADNTVLDFWQFNDLIERMPRAQLIIDLEHYLKNKTSWWYNHRGRCKIFLGVIKKTTDPKQCQQLVTAQIKLFAPESPPKPVKEAPRYASEVKQVTVKDGYYEALLKFQQQQFDEEEYQPSNTLTP